MNGMALCAGIGGLELGLRLAIPTYRSICFCERDSFAASVIVARMEDSSLDTAPVYSDLESFDGSVWRGKVDIISAGFPCQPHSFAGNRKGTEDERWIWDDIARIIRQVGPSIVLMENVTGLLSSGFERVLGNLAQMGFNAEWGCFSAEQCGLPHKRERLFILAYSQGDIWRTLRDEGQGALDGTSNTTLAHADNPDWWPRNTRIKEASRFGRGQLECSLSDMADTNIKGLQGMRSAAQGRFPQPCPPNPNDTAAWRRIAQINPTALPALCGVASRTSDELEQSPMSFRRDRLQALGNAVVPITAAVAFLTLWRRIENET